MSPIISEVQEEKLNRFVFHYRVYPFIALIILFFIVINIFIQLSRYSVYAANDYSLPYPGILPNHKLYPVKALRDRLVEMFTREPGKRAELYLLYGDKRIYMASMLGDQSEWQLSEATASKAEKYLLKLEDSVEKAKSIGGAADASFVNKSKQAANKHRLILEMLAKKSPQAQKDGFKNSLKLNSEFADWVKRQK